MPSRGSLPSTGRPYTLLTLLTGQRAPPLAKREGSFRFAFRGAKTARPTQARCPPTSLLVRGMRAPICIFVCVGTKLPQRKLVVNSVISAGPARLLPLASCAEWAPERPEENSSQVHHGELQKCSSW